VAGIFIGFMAGRYATPATSTPPPAAAQISSSVPQIAHREITKNSDAITAQDAPPSKSVPETEVPAKTSASTIAPKADDVISAPTQASPIKAGRVPPTTIVATVPPLVTDTAKKSPFGDWLDMRIASDAALIATVQKERYAIQLMAGDQRNLPAIESYLQIANRELNADQILIYPAGSTENPRVSVLYGNFDDREAANAALGNLPARVARFRPYARSFAAVSSDVRVTTP
jgi:DamX protein